MKNALSKTESLSFDAMGRVLTSRQTTNGTAYDFGYQYNAAGGMGQESYPSGRMVSSCYDEAGRISQVKQKVNAGGAETVVANVTGYAPQGAVQGLSLGGVVNEAWQYNARLQATQATAGGWQMNLYYCPGGVATCTANNGNILRQSGFGGAVWDYSYDALNRLKSVVETVSGVGSWHQTANFDGYGNRWILNDSGTLMQNLEATPRARRYARKPCCLSGNTPRSAYAPACGRCFRSKTLVFS